MLDMPRVMIGYDSNEPVALHVLAHSIITRASRPVQITPIVLNQVPLTRPRAEFQSTEFSFSRFLVPWLCDYEGKAIFMDSDMLCLTDICDLWDMQMNLPVAVVKHDYRPVMENKFLNQPQSNYPKKNWSSLMIFNTDKCPLTPGQVNESTGAYLHQFKWLGDDSMIGELPKAWNYLVGEENQGDINYAKILHYTRGTPCFAKYSHGPEAILWRKERDKMTYHNPIGEYVYEKAPDICGA